MFPNDDTPIPIPPPEVVRHRLTNTLRDARLLRDLLKLRRYSVPPDTKPQSFTVSPASSAPGRGIEALARFLRKADRRWRAARVADLRSHRQASSRVTPEDHEKDQDEPLHRVEHLHQATKSNSTITTEPHHHQE